MYKTNTSRHTIYGSYNKKFCTQISSQDTTEVNYDLNSMHNNFQINSMDSSDLLNKRKKIIGKVRKMKL